MSDLKHHLIILKNAHIFSPEDIGCKNMLLAGGKIIGIVDITADTTFNLPESLNVEVVDVAGKRLIPGLIDCHAHITGGGGESGFASQIDPVAVQRFTDVGVTTVVGLLGTDDTTRSTANLLARVYAYREQGLSAYCWTGGYHLPLTTLTETAKTDMVYLEPVIGIGEFAISDHRSSQPTFDEVVRLASEAHVAGLLTGKAGVVHFHLGDGDRKLELIERAITETEIPARVFHATHVNRNVPLFEDSLKLLKSGCYVDITAFPAGTADPGIEADEALLSIIKQKLPLQQITVSSDGGGCLPTFNAEGEMTHMDVGSAETLLKTLQNLLNKGQELGMVLPFFTQNVATLLRLKHKGSIVVGNDADFVILDDDHQITEVMGGGSWFVREGRPV
ncbi:MAG TPA: beta-aspartyl-peptidase [Aeromonadales bacterium]|nr:beta-aspartyl-peptidase [Aeromonadales bacterium]